LTRQNFFLQNSYNYVDILGQLPWPDTNTLFRRNCVYRLSVYGTQNSPPGMEREEVGIAKRINEIVLFKLSNIGDKVSHLEELV